MGDFHRSSRQHDLTLHIIQTGEEGHTHLHHVIFHVDAVGAFQCQIFQHLRRWRPDLAR